jgi:hydrogenase nickel incorporation protein HypA/HybF
LILSDDFSCKSIIGRKVSSLPFIPKYDFIYIMHEYSIAAGIAEAVLEAVKRNKGKKVLSIQLEMGELNFPLLDQITFLIQQLLKGSVAEGAKVNVRKIKAKIRCDACGYRGGIKVDRQDSFGHHVSHPCPQCGSFRVTIKKGEECILRKIEAIR